MKSRTQTGLAAAGFAVLLLSAACGLVPERTTVAAAGDAAANEANPDPATTLPALRVGALNIESLDPAFATSQAQLEIADLVFTPLVDLNRTGHPVPGAALSWESDNNIVWTFELDPAAHFHNGEKVTADSFVAAMMFLADPGNASPNVHLGVDARIEGFADMASGDSDTISGITAVDPHTLSITLTEPYGLLPSMLAHSAFSPRSAAAVADPASTALHPIGNGDFAPAAPWTPVRPLRLNPVGDGRHAVQFEFFDSTETMAAQRHLDVSHLPDGALPELRVEPGVYELLERPGHGFTYIAFPLDLPPFDNPDVRRALSLAVDRQRLVDEAFAGWRIPSMGFTPPSTPGGAAARNCTNCTYDPAEAQRLLDTSDIPIESIELNFNSGKGHEPWMQALGAQWNEVFGIPVSFNAKGPGPYFDHVRAGTHTGPYRLKWAADFPHAMSFIDPLFVGEEPETVGYFSEAVTATANRFELLDDPYSDDGTDLLSLITTELNEDMPIIPLFAENHARLIGPAVSGVSMNMDGSVRLGDAILTR